MIRRERTDSGFNFGAAEVSCACADDKAGWVIMMVNTPKASVQVYVTKTGKVRFYKNGKELL